MTDPFIVTTPTQVHEALMSERLMQVGFSKPGYRPCLLRAYPKRQADEFGPGGWHETDEGEETDTLELCDGTCIHHDPVRGFYDAETNLDTPIFAFHTYEQAMQFLNDAFDASDTTLPDFVVLTFA
jgi:hypothetical protein